MLIQVIKARAVEHNAIDRSTDSLVCVSPSLLFSQELRASVGANFGDIGLGSVLQSMTIKYFNPVTNLFILRVGREETPTAWAAATLMTAIHSRTIMVRILKISGALRKAQMEIIAHDKRKLR